MYDNVSMIFFLKNEKTSQINKKIFKTHKTKKMKIIRNHFLDILNSRVYPFHFYNNDPVPASPEFVLDSVIEIVALN